MNYQHKELADGRWRQMPFLEQMPNIGSEVERAIGWKLKDNEPYCQRAALRALELTDLTLDAVNKPSRYKELTRMREACVDFFFGDNTFNSTSESWRSYFSHFTFAARRQY